VAGHDPVSGMARRGIRAPIEAGLAAGHISLKVGGMSMTVDQLVEEIRSLPHDEMTHLVDRVLFESHGGQQPEHAHAWSKTVHRRIEEIRTGQVQLIPGEETSAKIRQIIGR